MSPHRFERDVRAVAEPEQADPARTESLPNIIDIICDGCHCVDSRLEATPTPEFRAFVEEFAVHSRKAAIALEYVLRDVGSGERTIDRRCRIAQSALVEHNDVRNRSERVEQLPIHRNPRHRASRNARSAMRNTMGEPGFRADVRSR